MRDSLCRLMAGFFRALAHPTRIAIVELLRDKREVPVSQIYKRLGLEQANVSQHLAVLRSTQIVNSRKDGNHVLYSLHDRMLVQILDLMRRNCRKHLNQSLELLEGLEI